MEERFEGAVQNIKKLALTPESKIQENHEAVFTEISDQFEVILDANAVSNLNDNLSGSPTFHPSLFNMPLFIEHKNICMCSRCTSVTFFTSTLEMINIQANLYYKTNEVLVAQSFMNGGFKLIKYLDAKLNYLNSNCFKINLNFRLEKIEEFSYIDSLNFSKCQFLRDTSYILIKENNLVKAESLNKQAIDMLSLVRPESHFLMQSVHEQKIFFLQSKVFKEETQNTLSNVDQLSNDLAAKLIVSPKKTDTASFKTPYERRTRPPNDSNRLKLNKGKNLFSDLLEATNFILPVIKFNLIDDNNTKSSAIREDTKSSAFNENLAKTPIVKFRLNKNVLLDNEPQTSNSNLPTKTRLRSNISKSTKIETSNVSKVQSKTKMKSKNPPKTSENEVNSDKVKTRSRSKVLSEVSSVKK